MDYLDTKNFSYKKHAIQLVARIGFLVFVIESAIMISLFIITEEPFSYYETILDSTVLTVICGPIIYFWLLKPYLKSNLDAINAYRSSKIKAETALAELGSHRRAMDEHAIVAVTDTTGTIIHASDKFCEISKYDRDELIGANHRILSSGHHQRSFFTDMYRTIANGGSWHEQIKNRAKDGSHYWVDTTITPVKDSKGKVIQYLSIRTDITDSIRAEEELRSINQMLQDRVRELEVTKTALEGRSFELQNTKQQLEHIAYFDGLTGLANRAHCQKDIAEKSTSPDADNRFAAILIDLDKFKRINDTLGHAAGDYLLQTVGKRLSQFARDFSNFKPYRWGGDEFIALVERNVDTDLDEICQELTDLISIPLKLDGATLRTTVSIGVARYPEDTPDLEALMVFADLALYRTKDLGRDGYHFFTSSMKEDVDAEARVELEMRIAIDDGQLELYYQPQLDINDETITGLEALLRWNHPKRGVIAPGEFLPVVESTGLAAVVGRKVFDEAMAAVCVWADDGVEFGRLAVNLSPQHLKQGAALDDFFAAMDRHGVEPHFLAVEFLESLLLDDPNADIADLLKQFRTRGIHVELDDFGTGYASLSHLSTMPINGLKIDKSFVRDMINDPKQQGIVSTLISMSKLMDLRVVCEGIETKQQVDAVAQIGNCSIQGYFIAKPMNFRDTTTWIKNKCNVGILRTLPHVAPAKSETGS